MSRLIEFRPEAKLVGCLTLGVASAILGFYLLGPWIISVFAPLVIAGYFAYRTHVDRLDVKTNQLSQGSRIHLDTVEALATAIDARDQIGSGHVRRTQIYAVRLGEKVGLEDDQLSGLRTASLLHDIGKLAVPDHILSMAEALSPAELEKTKIVSTVGASILEKINFQYPVVPTIRYHQEYWNGTGYPHGLSEESIPVTARILAIADAYDSLRSDRPYRRAMSRENARKHLISESGKQFDPTITQIFLKHLTTFESEIDALGLSYEETGKKQKMLHDRSSDYVEQIQLANREAFTLYELAREFGASVRIDETLTLFTGKIREFVPFSSCAIFLLDENDRHADVIHAEGDHTGMFMSKRIRVGEGATGYVLQKRKIIKNVNPDLDFSLSQLDLVQEYSTMASLPLMHDGELIGAVSVYSRDLNFYEDEHIRILETISRIAADAIGKSKQHDEAQAHALTDPMTGLPNARSLHMQFDREVARADRGDSGFQVLMLDLDGFKSVNDSHGHKVGDKMLDEVGQLILGQLREYDFLARYGGDEFVALIPNAALIDVLDLCKRIEKAVTGFKLVVDGEITASVGVSVGAAEYPGSGDSFDKMVAAADKAMYERKSRRKQIRAIEQISDSGHLSEFVPTKDKSGRRADRSFADEPLVEGFIVELDESHVISSSAIN